ILGERDVVGVLAFPAQRLDAHVFRDTDDRRTRCGVGLDAEALAERILRGPKRGSHSFTHHHHSRRVGTVPSVEATTSHDWSPKRTKVVGVSGLHHETAK